MIRLSDESTHGVEPIAKHSQIGEGRDLPREVIQTHPLLPSALSASGSQEPEIVVVPADRRS